MEKFLGQLMGVVPFVMMAGDGGFRLNKNRIIEAIIIASIGGLGAGFIATRELSIEITALKASIQTLSNKVDCLDNRLWTHQTNTENKK